MKITVPTLFSLLFLAASAAGQTVYLKYEGSCMDRLEYSADGESAAFISYSFDLGNGKSAVFDIGKENVKWVRDLPGKVLRCEDFPMDKELIRRINAGAVKVSMVRESPTHYNISEVDKATFVDNMGSSIEVVMEDAEFVLDMGSLLSNRNYAKPSSKLAVFLDGTIQYQCLKGYILRKMENLNSDSFKEYILVPEIGVVEKRSVVDFKLTSGGKTAPLKLSKLDSTAFSDKLVSVCDGIQAAYYDGQPLPNTGTPPQRSGETPVTGTIPTDYAVTPCGVNSDGIHFVQKGETLYGLSKRYGATLDNLRKWNGMGATDAISICQKMVVKDPAAKPANTGQTSSPGSTTTPGSSEGYWVKNAEVHIVRPGETVAGLAKLYGYTEERFRKMNTLAGNEPIYAGQSLHSSDCACPSMQTTTAGTPMPYDQLAERLTDKGTPDVYFRPVKVHLVKKSDTLFSVAKLYDTTVDRVKELNGLTGDAKLADGQKLYVQ